VRKGPVLEAILRKILLVDDDPQVLRATAELLGEGGYEVLEARTGAEALARLDAEPEAGLLVTDISLGCAPDGLALAREAARRRPGMRILIVSGAVRPAGADCPPGALFFTKPYAPGALLAILADAEAWQAVPPAQLPAGSIVTAA
jgi:DNA-binding NtrC family response regulator